MPAEPRTVLVVENNVIEREGMAFVLREGGFIVSLAPSAHIALAYPVAVAKPDLILLDMMMPDKDGWYFMDRRKTNPQLAEVPVLIVTGLGVASQEWATSLGARGVLKKPFDAADLLREVEGCLTAGD